jgi:hypothetical protein
LSRARALRAGAVMVTSDPAFGQVAGLTVEEWRGGLNDLY